MRLAVSACMIGGFAAQSLSSSATWSQPCLRVSDDGSDWLDSLPYFSCPAHTGRRPTALPRTIVWLPQPRPHRREAIGSIVLIWRVRSNAGTCGCSDNLSKKQVHGTGPRLLRTCTASHVTAPHVTASHVAASDVQLIRRPSTSIPGAGSPGLERSTGRDDSASPSPDVGRGASAVGPRSRASVGAPAGETFARTAQDDASSPSIELIRVRNSNELQVGDQAAGPRPPVRVVWPIPVSEVQPAEVSKADAKEQSARMVRPEADAAVNAGTESAARAGEGARRIFAHGAIGGAYFSLVWASRRRHFGMGGDEGGQYARRAISWNPSPRNRSRRPALREQAPRTRPG